MKIIHESGRRKEAIARATLKKGSGSVKINNIPMDMYEPKLSRLKLREPTILAGDVMEKVDITIRVSGGGQVSQAEAARLALSRALVKFNKKLETIFMKYDRQFLVADSRYKETRKPNRHGKARSKRQKSYR
ncbi:MAG: 30S ribosomal protein S9 [Candidatus Woesearchaeota archaeon]|jgi:small subunit ribosomal protein S9|nr:30S ribosomal protein S9 [Candidatus Woesearchaeota archaeon]MDP7457403.1 30S ribosomal protein S9 [Candidatus Woesearchaeota archaeon]